MLDYGDWNVPLDVSHYVSLVAYNGNGVEVDRQELTYTTPAEGLPRSSDLYGDLWFSGDAATALPGQPGNWTWNLSGSGIAQVVLEFGAGFDPNIGFDTIKYTTECLACQPAAGAADFSQAAVGESVEGVGAVAPYLDIDAKGTAVRIQESTMPLVYLGPNDNSTINGGIAAAGGFSDTTAQAARQAHLYTFTFARATISDFSLHMLDYGDWNPSLNTAHSVSLTAYDRNGALVAQQEINYTTQAVELPRASSLYGDLWFTGDGVTASPGQLGNWTWNLSGSGIVQIVLEFGPGFDPNIGFDTLNFNQQCP
jgi:hypothetical protein